MTTASATRRLSTLPSITLCVVLLFTGVVGALHHHDGGEAGHACAVCTASHAPAVPTVAVAGSTTPALLPGRVDAPRAELPPQIPAVAIAARAPPLA